MANECSETKTAPSMSSTSSSAADSYIGSFISLMSKYEIRYEGVLYYLNPQDSTLGLKNVKSYGTEGRKKDGPQIPPTDKVYEYILFKGSDIKDLQVKSSPPSQVEELIQNDPAVIQSQCATGASSSLKHMQVSGGFLTEFSPYVETSAPNMRSYPTVSSSQQSAYQVGARGPSQTPQSTNFSSYAMPMPWQGYSGATSANAYAQQHQNLPATSSIFTLHNGLEASPMQVCTQSPLTSSSICLPPMPSLTASNSAHPYIISSLTPEQLSMRPMNSPSLSTNSALPFPSGVMTANTPNMSSFISSAQSVNNIEAANIDKVFSDPVTIHPAQSLSSSASSVADSSFGPLLMQSPMLLTPEQLSHPRQPDIAPTEIIYPVQKDMVVFDSASSNSLSSISAPVIEAPLLTLQPPRQQFTEEFDFEAMNEKFKKDEVWGYLGKAKKRDNMESIHDYGTVYQTSGNDGDYGLATDTDSKPAYNKDEFFDSISCNTTARRGRNAPSRFSERMKLDTETFGQFQQRTPPLYGRYGAGRGIIRNPYGWGRGYNSSSQGRGAYIR
ncbi:hypothetical protein ACH5RR_040794 [Cinchona calisaya]|uniref:Uncharacterized protein n=1 Tax=Cinchona calisaya TaxID=153742 RepID=A0ABD2XWX5_9GENT